MAGAGRPGPPPQWTRRSPATQPQATAMVLPAETALVPSDELVALFLLPGGRPRRLVVAAFIADIQAGGRPLRRPRPRARRSRLMMASSICSRSRRSSVKIFDTSIFRLIHDFFTASRTGRSGFRTERGEASSSYTLFFTANRGRYQEVCSEFRTEFGRACVFGESGRAGVLARHLPSGYHRRALFQ